MENEPKETLPNLAALANEVWKLKAALANLQTVVNLIGEEVLCKKPM